MTQSQKSPQPDATGKIDPLIYTDPSQLDQDVDVLIKLAEQMAECGQIEQAEQIASMVLTVARSSDAHNLLGVGAYVRGDTRQAVAEFKAALDLDPDNLDAAKNLIDTYVRTGNSSESRILAAQMLARHPDDLEFMRLAVQDEGGDQALLQAG